MKDLVKKVWKDFVALKEELKNSNVIIDTMPILYFGDYEEYKKSPIKILTVSLNPSDVEFSDKKCGLYCDFFRFPKASCLQGKDKLSDSDADVYISSLNEYFEKMPYIDWFDTKTRRDLFDILDASYFKGKGKNTPLHVDIATPIATNPTWGDKTFEKEWRNVFLEKEKGTWNELISLLSPDIMLMSVDSKYIEEVDGALYVGMKETKFKETHYDEAIRKQVENERSGRFLTNDNYIINTQDENSKVVEKEVKVIDIVTVNKAFNYKEGGVGFGLFSKVIRGWKEELDSCQK